MSKIILTILTIYTNEGKEFLSNNICTSKNMFYSIHVTQLAQTEEDLGRQLQAQEKSIQHAKEALGLTVLYTVNVLILYRLC